MSKCPNCRAVVAFGGVRRGDLRYCCRGCAQAHSLFVVAPYVPEDVLRGQVTRVHQGRCPRCGRNGPVDVHMGYRVWSAFVTTVPSSHPHVGCRRCGVVARLKDAAFSVVLGWWGPFGLILTPVQVARNVAGMFQPPDPMWPSAELARLVRLDLAGQVLDAAATPTRGESVH